MEIPKGEFSQGSKPVRRTCQSLRRHYWFWSAVPGVSSMALDWVGNGVRLQWKQGPPPPRRFPNQASAVADPQFVDGAIAKLLATGAVQPCDPGELQVVSPLGVVQRRGKKRLIFNLQYVNDHDDLDGTQFKYESILLAREVVHPGDWLFTIDLESAYHHVDMHPSTWPYMGFSWGGQFYRFVVLPFGLARACWVFTKLTRELVERWRANGIRLIHYLDDFLFACRRDLALWCMLQHRVLSDLGDAGFSVSIPKLLLDAICTRVFVGFELDSVAGRLRVSPDRASEFRKNVEILLAHGDHARVKVLEQTAGQLASMGPAIGHAGRLFCRGIYTDIARADGREFCRLSRDSMAELGFWLHRWDEVHGRPLWPDTLIAPLVVFCDASGHGWGAHTMRQLLSTEPDWRLLEGMDPSQFEGALELEDVAHGYFTPEQRVASSTLREALGVLRGTLSLPGLDGREVNCFVDNQALAFIWERGSRKPHLNKVMQELYLECRARDISLAVTWVPRRLNQLADHISKFEDRDDWMLNSIYRRQLCDPWYGPYTFDRFATDTNAQCAQFNSLFWCPGSSGVDAFCFDWGGECNWCNPPFKLIGRVFRHMRRCGARGSIVVPEWRKQAWWPLLCPSPGVWARGVRAVTVFPTVHDLFLPGLKAGNAFGVGPPPWRVFAVHVDFSC